MSPSCRFVVVLLGVVLGTGGGFAQTLRGFPEGEAAITDLLVHYDSETANAVYPVLRDLARGLAPEVRCVVATSRPLVDAARLVLLAAGFPSDRLEVVAHDLRAITPWARDRLLALRSEGGMIYASPWVEEEADVALRGDRGVGAALSRSGRGSSRNRLDVFFYEGGNLLFDGETWLTTRAPFVADWSSAPVAGQSPAFDWRRVLGAPLRVLEPDAEQLHEHADLFLTVLGRKRVLLGDPRLAARHLMTLARVGADRSALPGFDDWFVQDQVALVPSYEAIARKLEADGYRIHRIPILHGRNDSLLSWNNALVERRDDGCHAFIPRYGIPVLDDAAADVYRRLGIRVHQVDVSRIAHLGGMVRCVTNVIGWRQPKSAKPGPR